MRTLFSKSTTKKLLVIAGTVFAFIILLIATGILFIINKLINTNHNITIISNYHPSDDYFVPDGESLEENQEPDNEDEDDWWKKDKDSDE